MARNCSGLWWVLVLGTVGSVVQPVSAQAPPASRGGDGPLGVPRLDLTYSADAEGGPPTQSSAAAAIGEPPKPTFDFAYRGASGFFNIREANANVGRGEWEFEANFGWSTKSGTSDEFGMAQSLKYGISDRFFIELEAEEPRLGEGGDSGAGDLNLELFYQFVKETDTLPAIAAFAKGRFPTGDGSSGVDGKLSAIVTKSITDRFRFHFQGFAMTANGSSGAGGDDREPFQWGLGPGFDYLINDDTLVAVNYLHRNNPTEGLRNQNILEFGVVRELGRIGGAKHELKLGLDVGLNGDRDTPNMGAKIQWGIEW